MNRNSVVTEEIRIITPFSRVGDGGRVLPTFYTLELDVNTHETSDNPFMSVRIDEGGYTRVDVVKGNEIVEHALKERRSFGSNPGDSGITTYRHAEEDSYGEVWPTGKIGEVGIKSAFIRGLWVSYSPRNLDKIKPTPISDINGKIVLYKKRDEETDDNAAEDTKRNNTDNRVAVRFEDDSQEVTLAVNSLETTAKIHIYKDKEQGWIIETAGTGLNDMRHLIPRSINAINGAVYKVGRKSSGKHIQWADPKVSTDHMYIGVRLDKRGMLIAEFVDTSSNGTVLTVGRRQG